MKHLRIILIFTLILTGCKSVDINGINEFYRERYFKDDPYSRFLKDDERARKSIFNTYFKSKEKKDSIIVIEYSRYYNGNFDILNTKTFFYQNNRLIKAYYLQSDKKSKIENITDELAADTKKTNKFILELLAKGQYEELKQLHKKTEYAVSDSGIIYVTFLDKDLNVLQGYMFNEFMVNELFNW
jgi:hypothetical protein